MSGTDALVLCQDAAPTFGRGTTALEVIPGTDPIADRLNTLTDRRTRETQEASNVRH
ncbi:hypothetical protein [Streptomyces sp. NPDC010273]|uniref:hypothetical protein n=1 Tax=Streptomyces sp. NPDC010273 TaxID=3364829 RepID=UPI0036EDC370